MKRPLLYLCLTLTLLATACAAASGFDSKRYASNAADAGTDPDTEPLPPEGKTKIADPKQPPASASASATAASTPTPAAGPEPVASAPAAEADAGAPAKPAAAPKPKPSAPPAAAAAATADGDCGSKENPCPMQKLMRGQMTSAGSNADALAAAFTKVAGLSPNPGWTWAAISKKGAELAKAGDVPGAKGQCKACHDQYKDAYKKQYRAKKI